MAVQTHASTDDMIRRLLKEAEFRLAVHSKFAATVEAFQSDLVRELHKSGREATSFFTRLLEGFEGSFEAFFRRMSSTATRAETEVAEIGKVEV
jgi:phosphohistidine phosphatase SixA